MRIYPIFLKMTDVEKTKALIRSVLLATPEGIPLTKFSQEYKEVTLQQLPSLGYKNVYELCYSLTDVIRIERSGNRQILFAVSHASTKHVEALIANQKKKKVSRPISNGYYGGLAHANGFHKSLLSRGSHSHPPPPHYTQSSYRQPRRNNQTVPSMRSPAQDKPKRAADSNQGRSVWDRLGKPPTSSDPPVRQTTKRDTSPERVVSISPDDSLLTSPSPPAASKKWAAPPNSPAWRHEYSQARNYPICELSSYARPGDLICVIGYFMGPRQVQERTLKTGRVLKLPVVSFPIHDSTFISSSSVSCAFKYPSWSIPTFNSPHQIPENTWLKVYGCYDDGQIAVSYLEVFGGVFKQTEFHSIVNDLSSLSIAKSSSSVTPPQDSNREVRFVPSPLSNHSSSPSDTSVYTDSGSYTTEEDEAGDQGYFSPAPHGRVDFPPSSSLSLSSVPNEFSSRVKSISSITHFYLVMDENDGTLGNLTNTLTTLQQAIKPGNVLIPGQCKDLLCSAFNVTSSQWHRAKFLNNYPNGSSTYAVSFIDLGEETQVPVAYIRPFLPEFLQLSAQALLCSLPLPQEMVSDQQLVSLFRKLVSNVPLKTRVKKMSENKFQVDLTTQEEKNVVSEIMSAVTDRKNSLTSLPNPVTRSDHPKFNLPLSGNDVFSPTEVSPRDVLIAPSIPSPVIPGMLPTVPITQLPTSTAPTNNFNGHFLPNNRHLIGPNAYPIPRNAFMNNVNSAGNDKLPNKLTSYFNIPSPSPKPASPTVFTTPPTLSPVAFPFMFRIPPPLYSVIGPLQRPAAPHYSYAYNQSPNLFSPPAPLDQELLQLIRHESLPITSSFKARVTSVFSIDRFYIQNCEKESELTKFVFSLQIYGKVNKKETATNAPVVEFCLAESRSKVWVRVQVKLLNMRSSEAQVFLLDYGTEETVPISSLLEISASNLQLPFQAISAKLGGTRSLIPNLDSTVSFKNLTNDKVLVAYPKLPSPSIVLVDTSVEPNRNINELLISALSQNNI